MSVTTGGGTVKNRSNDGGISLNSKTKKKLIELNSEDYDVSETYIQVGTEIYFGSSNNLLIFKNSVSNCNLLTLDGSSIQFDENLIIDNATIGCNISSSIVVSNISVNQYADICDTLHVNSNSVDIHSILNTSNGIMCRGGLNVDRIEGSNLSIAGLVLDNFVTREGIFDNRIQIHSVEANTPLVIDKDNNCNFVELNDVFVVDSTGSIHINTNIIIGNPEYPFKFDDRYQVNDNGHLTIGKSKVKTTIDSYDTYINRENDSLLHIHRRDDRVEHDIIRDPVVNITMDYQSCNNYITCNYERIEFDIKPFIEEQISSILVEDDDGVIVSTCNYQVIVNMLPFMSDNTVWNSVGELVEFSPFLGDPEMALYRPKLYLQKYDYNDYYIETINPLLNPEYIDSTSNISLVFGYWHTNQQNIIDTLNNLRTDQQLLSSLREGLSEYQLLEYSFTCNIFDEDLLGANDIILNFDIKVVIETSDDTKYMDYICNLPVIVDAPSLMRITCNQEHMFEISKDGDLLTHNIHVDERIDINRMYLHGGIYTDVTMFGCNISNVGKIDGYEMYLSKLRIGDIVEITREDGIIMLDAAGAIENRINTANIARINSPFLKYNDTSTTILNSFNVASNLDIINNYRYGSNINTECLIIGDVYIKGDNIINGNIVLDNVTTSVTNGLYSVRDDTNVYINANNGNSGNNDNNGTISFGNDGYVTLSTNRTKQMMSVGIPINRIELDFPDIEDKNKWYLEYENIISSQDLFLMNLHGINELQYDDYTQNTVFTVYGNSRFSDRRNLTLLNIREYTNQFPNEPTVDIYGNLRCKNRRIGVNTDGTFVTDNSMEAFRCEGNALITGKIQAIGGVSSLSDGRMKTNLKPITNALDKIKKLNGYVFTRTDNGNIESGLIAQDVFSVLPEVVTTDKNGTLSIAYGNMMGLIVEAIKEISQS
jgi:hypothetical protein